MREEAAVSRGLVAGVNEGEEIIVVIGRRRHVSCLSSGYPRIRICGDGKNG